MPRTLALPGGWASQTTDQGMVYYYNVKTGETTWEHPGIAGSGTVSEATAEGAGSAAAPAATTAASAAVSPAASAAAAAAASSEASAIGGGWEAVWADEHKMYYYCNRATGAAQWERPEPDQTGDQEPQPPTSSSGEGEGALPEDVRGGVDGSIEGSASDGIKGGNDGGSVAGKDSASSNFHHRREESPSTALKPTGESNDRRVPVEPRYGGQHSTHPEPTHQPTQQKQQQQQHASPLNVNTAFDWTKAGGATAAPSPKPRAQMPATVAEPRTVVGSAPPPTDKEGVVLRQALSRREESLRRLEEVRAGARSRLAALKAETDARRASRSALKAKGSTNSIKSSSSFGSTSSSASGGSGGVLAAPKSAAVAAAAAAAERQERASFDGRRFAPGSTADAAATTARRASFAGHTGGGFSTRFESSPPPGSRFSTAVGVMPPPLPPRSRAGRKKEKEAPAPMTAGEPSFEQLPPPPPAAAGGEGSASRDAPAPVPDQPGGTAAATGDEGGVRRCDEAVTLLPVDEGRGVRPALPGGAAVGSVNSTHSTSSLHTNSTSSTKSIGSSTQEASGRELIHTAREERQAPTSAAQGGVVVDGLAATAATAAAGGGGTGPLVGQEEGAAEKEGSEAGGRGPAAVSPPALAKVNDVRAFKALWRETAKIRGTATEPEEGERDSGEGLDREEGEEEAEAEEEAGGGGEGGGEGENGEVSASTQAAPGENEPVVHERTAATQEEAKAEGQPEGRESEGCVSDGNGVGGSGSTGGSAVDSVELDAVEKAVAAAGDCVGKGTAASHESGGKEEVAAVDSVELDPVVAAAAKAKAAGGDCVGKGTTMSHEGGEKEEGRELGAEENEGEREKVQAGWDEVDLSGAAAGEEVATIVAALAARPEQDYASDGATTVSSKGDGADDVRHAGTVEVNSSRGDGGGDRKETAVISVANFATAMECAIGLAEAAEAAAAAGEKEPPASTDGEEVPRTSPQETDDARGPSPQATFADVAPSAAAAAAAAPAAARMSPPPPLSSFSSISMCSSSLPSPARSPACPSLPPATPLASALDGATRRVSRLRELLGSVGEAEAWAGLLGGDDGRLCCRRLADLALSAGSAASAAAASAAPDPSSTAACRDNSDAGGGGGGGSGGDAAASARALRDRSRQLCSDALGCLAICGRIRTGVWVDLSRPGDGGGDGGSNGHDGGGHQRGGDDPSGSRLTRLLSLCVALAEKRDAAAERTGLNEHEYFFGMGSSSGEAEEQGAEPSSVVGLTLIYEILTGSCKSRAEGLRGWSGMSGLVRSLLDLIAEDREESSYMGATRCLLAANNPVLRGCSPPPPPLPPRPPPPPGAGAGAAATGAPAQSGRDTAAGVVAVPARPLPPSTVIPALLCHPARHEVQGAVLHIFNEEGYPNGDAGLARLCLAFCSDAYAEGRTADLFYVNDVKVMIDIIVRELYNLPAEEALRMDYRRLLRRLLEESEWSTKGDKYRERDIERAAGITTTT